MVAFLLGNIVMSVAPAESSYWQTIFPALILVISGPGTSDQMPIHTITNRADLSFATGQLIVSNSVDREFQGIAGESGSSLWANKADDRRHSQHDYKLLVSPINCVCSRADEKA